MLSTASVARRLNFDRSSISRLFRNATIPGAVKVGGVWRIHENDLKRYLEGRMPCQVIVADWLASPRSRQQAALPSAITA